MLPALGRMSYRPDVVIMDVVMPGLDGVLATRQILKAVPDQLVIVLTGAQDEDDELGLWNARLNRRLDGCVSPASD